MATTRTNEHGQIVGGSMSEWAPRVKPQPVVITGRYVTMEPLDAEKHTPQLWEAFAVGSPADWTYLFAEAPATEADLLALYRTTCAREDVIPYVIVDGTSGKAVGTISFMNVNLQNGDVEIGSINLSHQLRKTRQSTEAIYLMISRVMDDLGYRRITWKCDALNKASRQAAARYGFVFEGLFRNHMVLKGRTRDTAWFSITDYEWIDVRKAYNTWLDPANFDSNGQQIKRLSDVMPTKPASSF